MSYFSTRALRGLRGIEDELDAFGNDVLDIVEHVLPGDPAAGAADQGAPDLNAEAPPIVPDAPHSQTFWLAVAGGTVATAVAIVYVVKTFRKKR